MPDGGSTEGIKPKLGEKIRNKLITPTEQWLTARLARFKPQSPAVDQIEAIVGEEEKSIVEPAVAPEEPPVAKLSPEADDQSRFFLDEKQPSKEVLDDLPLPSISDFPPKIQMFLTREKMRWEEAEKSIDGQIKEFEAATGETKSKLQERVQKIFETAHFPTSFVSYGICPEYIPKEIFLLMRTVNEKLRGFCENREEVMADTIFPHSFDQISDFRAFGLNLIEQAVLEQSKRNQEFGQSRRILTHALSPESLSQVLRTQALSSKKHQLDTQGEYYFHTAGYQRTAVYGRGGVRVAQDGRIYAQNSEGKYMHEIPPGDKWLIRKVVNAEMHDVDFTTDGFHDFYEKFGLALVFSERSLYAKSQFGHAVGEGDAIYPIDYYPNNPQGPGAFVDLTREPFLLVIDPQKADPETIKSYVRQIFPSDQAESWINEHVVVESEDLPETELVAKVKAELFARFSIPELHGFTAPMDETGRNKIFCSQEYPISPKKAISLAEYLRIAGKPPQDWEKDPQEFIAAAADFLTAPVLVKGRPYSVEELFQTDAQVNEGYLIITHTQMGLRQLERYFACRDLPSFHGKPLSFAFFRTMYTFHDLPKSAAIREKGNKFLQHEFAPQIMGDLMRRLNFSEDEVKLAQVLAAQDWIGEYVNPKTAFPKTLEQTKEKISQVANELQVSPGELFAVAEMFYLVDFGAYTVDAGGQIGWDAKFAFDHEGRKMGANMHFVLVKYTF